MPPKPFELLLDDAIENTIDDWIETKHREPVQEELWDDENCQGD